MDSNSPPTTGDPREAYTALTTTAALIDLDSWGLLRLTGSDRVRLLNALVTNDVASLETGRACHAALTTIKGKLVAELFVLAREAELVALVAQGDVTTTTGTIRKHIIADDVTVEDASGAFGMFAVEGPKAREIVWRIFPEIQIPVEPLRFVDTAYQGTPVAVFRNTVSGEQGYHLIVPADGAGRIREYVVQAGRGVDMAVAGREAWNARRVEAGLPWFGVDVTVDNFPKECRLDEVVSYEKGCFLGQETLARMHHRGHPNWLLVGLATDDIGDTALDLSGRVTPDTEFFATGDDDGKPAGRVTSAVYSPMLGKPLFLGYVRTQFAEMGTQFALPLGEESILLTVVPLPAERRS